MKVFKIVIIVLISLGTFAVAFYFLTSYLKEKPGGILIDTTPAASVYVNGVLVGSTPFKGSFPAGQITLKLVPKVTDQDLVPYETRITLVSGVETVVRREFAVSEDDSSGDILSFDKEGAKKAGLYVISIPANAQVSIDGTVQGFTPLKISSISPAQHRITVKAPGYLDRVMTVQTFEGLRLTVFAKLGRAKEVPTSFEITPSTQEQPKIYVKILETPTGYLRVRTLPGSAGDEIAEVKSGSEYPYLGRDVVTGWYKIQYQEPAPGLPEGITGWVSNQYSQISSQSATLQQVTP
jgi:hypothetical protein